ncbi:protein FAM149B1-like X2, partial [Biomphalaria pfeifferi]
EIAEQLVRRSFCPSESSVWSSYWCGDSNPRLQAETWLQSSCQSSKDNQYYTSH